MTLSPLPVETLVPGFAEHVAAHKALHDFYNRWVAGEVGGPGGGSGTNRELAKFTHNGTVIPVFTGIEVVDDDAHIAKIKLTVIRKPFTGRQLVLDVLLNGDSIWPNPDNRPVFTATDPNPGIYTLSPTVAVSAGNLLQGVVVDGGSAAELRWKLVAA